VLRNFDRENHQASISHEKIPGYMPAMTMSFNVRNDSELENMKPGDAIAFRLCVTRDDAWVEEIRKTGGSPVPLFTPAPAALIRELNPGDVMPDVELVSHQNKKIRLGDYRSKVVALTFIYTRCPLPTYCPLINQKFKTVQELMSRLDAGDGWRLLSISMDPESDTPDALADFAKNFGADEQHWTFATGETAAVRQFGGAVGLEFNTRDGQINHNLRTVVVDGDGRIRHIFRGNTWSPQELVAEMHAAIRTER